MILKGYNKDINSVFELLGNNENDITKSIAFCLSRCLAFTELFLFENGVELQQNDFETLLVTYQQTQEEGITDIEIIVPGKIRIIIEAKKGFNIPSVDQLNKYASDLKKSSETYTYLWTLSDSLYIEAFKRLPQSVNEIHINHITYETVLKIAEKAQNSSNRSQKNLLVELIKYLKGIINMHDLHSNTVYVVPIDKGSVKEHDEKRQYHCPVGDGFLKAPENYLGFRFNGKLQYINHVESVETYIDGDRPMFRFNLGPDIIPSKTVKTGGKFRGTKFYCDIDLLLTSDTILEANLKTKERHK